MRREQYSIVKTKLLCLGLSRCPVALRSLKLKQLSFPPRSSQHDCLVVRTADDSQSWLTGAEASWRTPISLLNRLHPWAWHIFEMGNPDLWQPTEIVLPWVRKNQPFRFPFSGIKCDVSTVSMDFPGIRGPESLTSLTTNQLWSHIFLASSLF